MEALQAQRTGDSEATTIATGTTPTNGILAELRPDAAAWTAEYDLTLRATDTAGQRPPRRPRWW